MSLESRTAPDDGTDRADTDEATPSGSRSDGDGIGRRATGAAPIDASDLTKRYDETLVFEGLDLHVEPGEVLCLLGPSGCGKTTLLHLLAGLEEPTGGDVEIDGQPVTGPDYRWGVVFQDPLLYPWLSVRENVAVGPRLRGEDPDPDRIDDLLDLVGLDGFEDAATSDLSGGMAQRASLARTLANDPEVLLLDEPFSALDQLTKMELQDELRRIVDDLGVTTVFVTHDIDEAVYLGDRVAIMGTIPDGIEHVESIDSDTRSRDDESFLEDRAATFERLEQVGLQ
ncbi:ABC transporter ATP-binding protein [Halobellus ruber]|uniref:ABC transporter ATP-binding protein n=1 Tax=Halobellus ruber TaxID=2761102 RepID=A0A7J9SH09_9EURY|nr:ABC transporter ATP-binding protein [Halobellus ruber]MBB6645237.1 ABC transporter ATP-binding protein [Halobellus ruber]